MAFWKKKKEVELPELPPLPSPPRVAPSEAEEAEEVQPLPTFPESPTQKGFAQAAIKEAVATEPEEVEEAEEVTAPATVEMEEEMLPSPPAEEREERVARIVSAAPKVRSADIYVKVDKFTSARKALESTQAKLEEISELLKVIRETKMREEQELAYLEKELSTTKAKVQEITENIFEKI